MYCFALQRSAALCLLMITCLLMMVACSDDDGDDGESPTDPNETSEYFMRFTLDGESFEFTNATATRDETSDPHSFTISGSAEAGQPAIDVTISKPSVGWTPGNYFLRSSSQSNRMIYTDSDSQQFSTVQSTEEISFFIGVQFSFEQGSELEGRFSGRISVPGGQTLQFTDGEYKVKFAN